MFVVECWTTILTSGGGGGSSLSVVASAPVSSTFMLPELTEAETHLKKALIVALSAVSSDTTHSVIFLQRIGVGASTGSACYCHTPFAFLELGKTFVEVICRLTVSHNENEWLPVAFLLGCSFGHFLISLLS